MQRSLPCGAVEQWSSSVCFSFGLGAGVNEWDCFLARPEREHGIER